MRKQQYEEQAKPMIWSMFATASLSNGNTTQRAATHADDMLKQFEERFPVEADD